MFGASPACILKCYDFVYGFNYQSLTLEERDIFFPWLPNMLASTLWSYLDDVFWRHITIRKCSKHSQSSCYNYNKSNNETITKEILDIIE